MIFTMKYFWKWQMPTKMGKTGKEFEMVLFSLATLSKIFF